MALFENVETGKNETEKNKDVAKTTPKDVDNMSNEEKTAMLKKLLSASEVSTQSVTEDEIPDTVTNPDEKFKDRSAPTKEQVKNAVNELAEPYNSDVSSFIKAKNITGLQDYINDYNKKNNLLEISADGGFGPETLDALMKLTKKEKKEEEKKEKEEVENFDGADWIVGKMQDKLDDIRNNNPDLNRKKERNDTKDSGGNTYVDTKTKTVTIATWGLEKGCDCQDSPNKCTYNWETGDFIAHFGGKEFLMPFPLGQMKLDKDGMPDETDNANNEIINAMTSLGNLTNYMQQKFIEPKEYDGKCFQYDVSYAGSNNNEADGVFGVDGAGAIEMHGGWVSDTDILSSETFRKIMKQSTSLNGQTETAQGIYDVGVAYTSMLNAMKITADRLTLDQVTNDRFNLIGYSEVNKEKVQDYLGSV